MQVKSNLLPGKISVSFTYWLQHHIDCAKKSLARLLASPLSFVITILMISIAFIIPAAVYVLFNSVDKLTQHWSSDKQITLFLSNDANLQQAQSLRDKLLARPDIATASVINKEEALKEFKKHTNLGSITDSLPTNPIPHLVIANPNQSLTEFKALQLLYDDLRDVNLVEHVQFDLIWVQRLQATISILYRVLWIITILLLAAVFLIIANVIRWEVASRHDELEIIRLVGGSDAYVRRPFLYSGFWLGLVGATVAIVMVKISGWIIGHSLKQLIMLYSDKAQLASLPAGLVILMLLLGGLFGAAGAWVAVRQRLQTCA